MFIHVFRRSPSLSCLIFKYEISQLYLQCLHYRSTFLGSQDWNVLSPVFSSFGTFQNGLRGPITKQLISLQMPYSKVLITEKHQNTVNGH
ncbi:unnamed protein product [Schistosoma intercalatum]|nr:unnamed protein product [Schistosoma intercalatum]CAH8453211.1 unnamed protein product [Schistosoma intercalatum]